MKKIIVLLVFLAISAQAEDYKQYTLQERVITDKGETVWVTKDWKDYRLVTIKIDTSITVLEEKNKATRMILEGDTIYLWGTDTSTLCPGSAIDSTMLSNDPWMKNITIK